MHVIGSKIRLEESRCYECGAMLFGGAGMMFGDVNPDVKMCPRALCNLCILKAAAIVKLSTMKDPRLTGEPEHVVSIAQVRNYFHVKRWRFDQMRTAPMDFRVFSPDNGMYLDVVLNPASLDYIKSLVDLCKKVAVIEHVIEDEVFMQMMKMDEVEYK